MAEDEFEDRDDDESEENEEGLKDLLDTLATDEFKMAGLECLDESRIFACGFSRTREKMELNVQYALGEANAAILSAPLDRFDSDEAYYTMANDNSEDVTTLILRGLTLTHMEVDHDIDTCEVVLLYLVYKVESFEQKILKKPE